MIELPDNPAPKWQLERVMKLIKETLDDAKAEFCIFDEELYRGTMIALNDKGYHHQRDAENRTFITISSMEPRLQMEKVAKLLQATIEAGLSYCVIDERLFIDTINALSKKGYVFKTNSEGTCIGLYPKAINAWLESNKVERLRANIE